MTILLCYKDISKYIWWWWWWWGGGLGDPYFFLHISSSWVKIRLHTENQPPRLSGSALKVVVWGGGPTDYFVTPNSSWGWVGLWQLCDSFAWNSVNCIIGTVKDKGSISLQTGKINPLMISCNQEKGFCHHFELIRPFCRSAIIYLFIYFLDPYKISKTFLNFQGLFSLE